MLRTYDWQTNRLVPVETPDAEQNGVTPVWTDLINPTPEENAHAEKLLGVQVPSRDEMEEIELSARLYHEDGAEFMTITALANLDTDAPAKTPVTFILKDQALVTVRYVEPKPFRAFLVRSQRPGVVSASTGELTMLGIVEAIVDRLADTLERAGNEIDAISAGIFRNQASTVSKKTRNLQSVIERIGRQGDLLTMVRESLVSITRLAAYHAALEEGNRPANRESRQRTKLIQRDVASLAEHAAFMSNKINFLLDATLGLINLEQNQIIKIFSVAAVVFLPPTLVASNYGMNFDFMPELHWLLGYPFAITLMVISAVVPFLYFKGRGWL
ncbi:MAG: magnesium transporter CorA family protein [Devosia sp.]|nr:magnesium transporter CorA family protein [Devosia sp.]